MIVIFSTIFHPRSFQHVLVVSSKQPARDLLSVSNMEGDLESVISKCQELDTRMDDLDSKMDSQRTRLATTAAYVSKVIKQATMIQDQMQGFERRIKKQVEESLLEWRLHMDQQHSEFQQQQNNWQSVMQSSITDTCEQLKSNIEAVRSNGELATQNMTQMLDEQVKHILGQQRKLVISTTEQFEQLDVRVKALDSLMQQSQEILSDVKSRQDMASKLYQKQMRHGPLAQQLQQQEPDICKPGVQSALDACNQSNSGSSSQLIEEADVRCKVQSTFVHATHRAEVRRRESIETKIRDAQNRAVSARGRSLSLSRRIRAAQDVARSSRSTSRSVSEAG